MFMVQIQAPELDPIVRLRIGHDNSGHGGSWHLDFVEVGLGKCGDKSVNTWPFIYDNGTFNDG